MDFNAGQSVIEIKYKEKKMNKSKKLAFAAVAVVMAGAMAASIAGCKDKNNNKNDLDVNLDANNQLTYAAGTTIKTALGYNSDVTGIKYVNDQIQKVAESATADNMIYAGKRYVSGDLKPAWQALTSTLGINVVDEFAGKAAEAGQHISYLKQNNKMGEYSLITASSDTILSEDSNTWVDINKYLDYMPNYKQFLEENAVTRMSVTANTNTGAMYMVPYYDGNNDIEKYVLMRKDIVEKILDATDLTGATGTFASQANTKNSAANKGVVTVVDTSHSVESFMGKTAADNYTIKVTDPAALRAADTAAGEISFGNNLSYVTESKKNDTVELTVDYGAVIAALQDSSSALYQAAAAPLGTNAVQTASGNIVDIQNQMIDASNGEVKGAQLTKVLQEYIKVAYHKTGESTPFYSKLSDVFNSAYAAWDVDLYVAFGRASMASSGLLGESSKGENAYLLASRTGFTNRTYDIASMAGELYGIRGLTSRYTTFYAYIDKEGNIKDARNEAAYWNALSNMSKLAKEGLYYTGEGNKDGYLSIANGETNTNIQVYSSTDYVQTQTRLAGYSVDGKLNKAIEAGYNYAPILTPVSRWDVNGDGTAEEVMRFTESWRGVKNGGLCIPKAAVSGNPDKLSATLKVIDWMFSNDGQIVMTYGPFSKAGNITRDQGENENADYGTWYGKPADKTLEQAKTEGIVETVDNVQYRVKAEYQGLYFCFENKLYSGTYYNGKQVPTPTDEVMTELMKINEGKFTDHARQYIGSALNFGNKDQGFEAQCTPNCGLVGANIWAIAKVNGTIVYPVAELVNDAKYGYWRTLVPTVLPFTDAQTSAMKTNYQKVTGMGGAKAAEYYFYANGSAKGNILTDIMYYGFDTIREFTGVGGVIPGNAQGIIALLNTNGMQQVDGFMETAWGKIKTYYTTNLSK